jgi:hypothetical protein
MNYYCLVAGLPDINADDTKGILSLSELKLQLLEELSQSDGELLKIIFATYDNQNFLTYLKNHEAALHPAGNLTLNDWDELLALMKEYENPVDKRLLPYIITFYQTLSDDKSDSALLSKEDLLTTMYYDYALKSDNLFLRKWFEFNLNVNNLLAGIACRKHGFDPKTYIIGNNEVANAIRHSNARDYGVSGLFEEYEMVIRISEESDLLEREKKIDALKWAWLDENTFFNYFSIEKILAFVLKIEMIQRWKILSVEKGGQVFRQLLAELKEGVKFED